jgi:hypothetical protein
MKGSDLTMQKPGSNENGAAAVSEWVEDAIAYYNRYGFRQLVLYRALKTLSIGAAAFVPVVALQTSATGPSFWPVIAAALGAITVASEAINQVFRCHDNWVNSVKAAEALESELLLYQARAGLYATAADSNATFAQRVVAITTSESNQWVHNQLDAERKTPTDEAPGATDRRQTPS